MKRVGLLVGFARRARRRARLAAFVVDTTEYAVVTRFGRPVRTYTTPGLRFRVPLIDQVVRLDARLLMTEPPVAEYLTLDKKNVVARVFLTWRVDDPLRYLQTVTLREAAEARLAAVTSSEIGAAFGSVPFDALVSTDPQKMRLGTIVETGRRTGARDGGARVRHPARVAPARAARLPAAERGERIPADAGRAPADRQAVPVRG